MMDIKTSKPPGRSMFRSDREEINVELQAITTSVPSSVFLSSRFSLPIGQFKTSTPAPIAKFTLAAYAFPFGGVPYTGAHTRNTFLGQDSARHSQYHSHSSHCLNAGSRMDGSQDNQMSHWGDGLPSQPQESWDPNHASMMFNNAAPEDMNMMDAGQWQTNQDPNNAFNYRQHQAFAPQTNQHQIYQNVSWMGQAAVNMGVDNTNNGLQTSNPMYGSMPQNGHVPYSQPPNGNLYSVQATGQQHSQSVQPVKQIPQTQFHQGIANSRMQQTGSPAPIQQRQQQTGHSQSVPVSYILQHHQMQGSHTPPVQSIPQQPQQQEPSTQRHGQGHFSNSPHQVPRQPLAQPQLQYAPIQTDNDQERVASELQPIQQTPSPNAPIPQPAASAPAALYSPAPIPPPKPRFQFLDESKLSNAKSHFKPATHLFLGSSTKLVPAYNYKFKVAEARHNSSGKPVLGSQLLPCEIERDAGRAYRECATSADATPEQQDKVLDKYRDAMKNIGRPITDPSRGPSKRKERTSTLVSTATSSDEYSESEDDDELPPPPLDGPRPGPEEHVKRAVWDILNIVWSREDVPSMEETQRRFIEFGETLLRLSKEFMKAVKEGDRDFKSPYIQGLLQAVEATSDYATPYILMHLGETDKALGALANCLLALYNKGYKDDETRAHVVLLLSLLSEFGTVSAARYEEIRLTKIVPRMAKRFGGEVEELRQKIEKKLWKKDSRGDSPPMNGKQNTNASSTAASTGKMPAAFFGSKMAVDDRKGVDALTKATKRAREDDNTSDAPAAKKTVAEARIKKIHGLVSSSSVPKIIKAGGLLPGKLPGKHAVPSKSLSGSSSTGISSKASASTAPGVSDSGARKSAPSAAKPEKKQQAPPPDSSASRLGALLDSISNSATAKLEETKKKKEASETPEQREKRISREKRGAHRVRWKDDDILVEVRTFVTEEDASNRPPTKAGANRHRDEGEVLKSASKHRDIEDDDALLLLTAEWTSPPSHYNFSNLPLDTFKDRPFRYSEIILKSMDEDTGLAHIDGSPDLVAPDRRQSADGADEYFAIIREPNLSVETEEQGNRQRYENSVLLVAYQSREDIPPTPRSPARSHADVAMPDAPKHITLADSEITQEVIRRFQEVKSQGREASRDIALRRLGKTPSQPAGAAVNPTLMDALARLGAFNQAQAAQQPRAGMGQPLQQTQQPACRITDPRALLSTQKPSPRVFANQEEQEAETFRLFNTIIGRPPFDLGLSQTPRRRDQLHPKAREADEFLAPISANFAGKPAYSNECPMHIINDATRVREWFDGIRRDEGSKRREEDMAKAKSVTAAIKAITERATAAATRTNQTAQPAATPTPAAAPIDHAAAWHAYNTMSQEDYAAWWQVHSQQLAAAEEQQPTPQQAPPQPDPASYAVYNPSQPQSQQPTAATQYPQAQPVAAPAVRDPLQAAQSDPNFAQYLQMAYALQAQQAQDGSGAPQPQPQPQQQQQQQQYDPKPRSPPGRDENAHESSSNHHDHGNNYNRHENNHNGQSRKKDRHHKPIKAYLIGTKPCTFFKKGKCTKGANCTYRHD
ncbi:uncharacterized protein MKZ38_007939 [Zalerion maritima]|uniref:C3H1-type domain-containing protein n=1 Tax=Zalerion maritima TaxID=339359 RepID=A0AAD5RVN5_9PEZI|nr:uncharacterized protein MKZ38_007939 [Zalerion maritima]